MKIRYLFFPAIKLMDKLNFNYKFGLISSMFALPLFLSLSLILTQLTASIDTMRLQQKGLQQIIKLQGLIHLGVEFRDISIIATKDLSAAKEHQTRIKEHIQEEFNDVLSSPLFLESIYSSTIILSRQQMKSLSLQSRLEITDIQAQYNQANNWLNTLYQLESSITIDSKLIFDRDPLSTVITKIFPDLDKNVFFVAGQNRAFGAFYLDQGYLNAPDIIFLTNHIIILENLKLQISKFHIIFSNFSNVKDIKLLNLQDALDNITHLETLLSENILLPENITMRWSDYFEESSYSINALKKFELLAVEIASKRFNERLHKNEALFLLYSIFSILVVCVFIYLYLGFYISIEKSLNKILKGAKKLRENKKDFKIELHTKDEFRYIAEAFNHTGKVLILREAELKELSVTDELTKIKNRKHFNFALNKHLSEMYRTDKPISLLIIDIDYFKKINDTHGHIIGDKCLIHIANTLKKSLDRDSDTLARFGGEEFVIILPYTNNIGAQSVADRIMKLISDSSYKESNLSIPITVSIGISSINHVKKQTTPEELAEILLHEADTALYQAKSSGRNRWVEFKSS